MKIFDTLAIDQVKAGNMIHKSEMLQIIMQELEQMGYQDTLTKLTNEVQLPQSTSPIIGLKQQFMLGEYEAIQKQLNGDAQLVYEVQKQSVLEQIQHEQYQTAVQQLRQIRFNINNTDDATFLSKLIFSPNVKQLLIEHEIPLDINEQRIQLYYKCVNYSKYGEFTMETQLDKLIKQSYQYQIKKCQLHTDGPLSLLCDHNCSQQPLPIYNTHNIGQFDDQIWIAKYSPSGHYIGCATRINSIYIMNLKNIRIRIHNAHTKDINCLAFNNKDTQLFSGSNDCEIHCYETLEGMLLMNIKLHTTPVLSLMVNDSLLYSGGVDNWVGVWQLNGQLLNQIKCKVVKNILLTPNYLILHHASVHTVSILDISNKYQQIALIEEQEIIVSSSISQNKHYLLLNVSKSNPELHLWSLQTFKLIHKYKGYLEKGYEIQCCFMGRHDNYICVGSDDGKVHLFNRDYPLKSNIIIAHDGSVNAIDWNQYTQTLLSAGDDKSIKLWSGIHHQTEVIIVKDQHSNHMSHNNNHANIDNVINEDDDEDDYEDDI